MCPQEEAETWSSEPFVVTEENFHQVVETHPAVFVYMWAEACEPCEETKTRLDELVPRFRDQVLITTLRTDEQSVLAKQTRSWRGRLVGKLTGKIDGPLPGLLLYVDGDLTARDAYINSGYDDKIEYLADWIRDAHPALT